MMFVKRQHLSSDRDTLLLIAAAFIVLAYTSGTAVAKYHCCHPHHACIVTSVILGRMLSALSVLMHDLAICRGVEQ